MLIRMQLMYLCSNSAAIIAFEFDQKFNLVKAQACANSIEAATYKYLLYGKIGQPGY